ncbi:MAG: hypothetical protein ACLPSF_04180 [Methylocella sp.]
MTIRNVEILVAGGLLLGGAVVCPMTASAAPMLDPGVATAAQAAPAAIEDARWVCGPYRCWWRPNYYYGYGWHRPWGYYGWHRPWGYGWHGGWHRGWGWRGGWHHGWRGGWHHGWRR